MNSGTLTPGIICTYPTLCCGNAPLLFSQGDTTSSNAGEEGEEGGNNWVKREGERFAENDRILVWYGRGKNLQTYEAKIIGMEESENKRDYLVHYSGWNNR